MHNGSVWLFSVRGDRQPAVFQSYQLLFYIYIYIWEEPTLNTPLICKNGMRVWTPTDSDMRNEQQRLDLAPLIHMWTPPPQQHLFLSLSGACMFHWSERDRNTWYEGQARKKLRSEEEFALQNLTKQLKLISVDAWMKFTWHVASNSALFYMWLIVCAPSIPLTRRAVQNNRL